jgi:hypothetical protein
VPYEDQRSHNPFPVLSEVEPSKKNPAKLFAVAANFSSQYGEKGFENITPDEVYGFLENLTQNLAKSTRRLRYAQLKPFFNFFINRSDLDIKNPCDTSLLSKTFRIPKQVPGESPTTRP